jgi:hypothetical protein
MSKSKRICDTNAEDYKFLEKFEDELDMLTGMCAEMLETNKVLLLSPVMREMLAEKAKLVASMRRKLMFKLVVDNPCEPLSI